MRIVNPHNAKGAGVPEKLPSFVGERRGDVPLNLLPQMTSQGRLRRDPQPHTQTTYIHNKTKVQSHDMLHKQNKKTKTRRNTRTTGFE